MLQEQQNISLLSLGVGIIFLNKTPFESFFFKHLLSLKEKSEMINCNLLLGKLQKSTTIPNGQQPFHAVMGVRCELLGN